MNDTNMTANTRSKQYANKTTSLTMQTILKLSVIATFAATAMATPATAIDTENPDWPCTQRKVKTLTSAQIWDGPPVDEEKGWLKDKEVYKLVPVILSRRIDIEEVEKTVEKFAQSISEADRDKRLTLLFAGVLDRTNTVRKKVLEGIERFQRRQEARAKELERQGKELVELKKKADADKKFETDLKDARNRYDWDARILKSARITSPSHAKSLF